MGSFVPFQEGFGLSLVPDGDEDDRSRSWVPLRSERKPKEVNIVPTAEGPMEIVEPFTVSYLGAAGTYQGERMSGVFEFIPVEGDCVSTPLTKVLVVSGDRRRG